MDHLDHRGFKHTTLDSYPAKVAGITLRDESPGFTGVYVHDEAGGLYPARTVSHEPAEHHASVIASWLRHEGKHRDERATADTLDERCMQAIELVDDLAERQTDEAKRVALWAAAAHMRSATSWSDTKNYPRVLHAKVEV